MNMRTIYKIPAIFGIALVLFLYLQSCSDILVEHPRTLFTTAYFETPQGIQDAVNAAYADMRYIYAPNGSLAMFHQGTDEWTFGEQPATNTSGDNFQHRELGIYTISSGAGALTSIWNRAFPAINLCNGILESVTSVPNLTEDQVNTIEGEASFLRALYYLNLVTQFGAVPLDLGSGDLKLNTTPFFGFNRLPLDELLVNDYQAMIDDLTTASEKLPVVKEPNNYKLTQAAALSLLAKVYLYRYYTDAAQAGDAQSAYDAAMELINNRAMYGVELLQDFGKVFKQGYDYNSEILYSVERIPGDQVNNEIFSPSTDFTEKVNIANNLFIPSYQQSIGGVSLIDGRPLAYQRPLRKIAPTKWLTMECFADKTNDSRYYNTFRTLYRTASVNDPGTQGYQDYVDFLATRGMVVGDTAWYMPDTQAEADAIASRGVNYFVVGPDDWYTNQHTTYIMHPALRKYDDSLRVNYNDVSGRPYPVLRLAETYLLAAEAAMILGHNDEASTLVNVLKKRAAYKPGRSQAAVDAAYANIAATADSIDLDYILDERSREMAGEWSRWADLAIRKYSDGSSVLLERVRADNPDGGPNVQAFHLVRPIPQSQIDAVNDPNREQFQNPGYSASSTK